MKVNLVKPTTGSTSPGSAAAKNEIILIEAESIMVFPPSDENGVVMEGSFVLTPGEKMVTLYSTKSKTSASMETDGDEDAMSFKSKFEAQHPGNSKELKEFVQYWNGKNIIILHKACGETHYEVMGTPCAPLQLKATKQDNNDARHYTMSFEPFAKSGFVPKIYTGAVVFAEPFQVSSAVGISLVEANGVQYKLPANTDEVVDIHDIDLKHGKVVTFIGTGGDNPASLVNGVSGAVTVVLTNGSTWTAIENAVIHLKVFKAGSVVYLFELSRE